MSCGSGLGQQPVNPVPGTRRVLPSGVVQQQVAGSEGSLTRFDLDFPGGTPEQLVRAIEKASTKPLNAIVPTEFGNLQLPPLKMKAVTVPALFQALQFASRKDEVYVSGSIDYGFAGGGGIGTRNQYQQYSASYGFETQGFPSDDSVWYFFSNKRPKLEEPKSCRFYNLAPYLETYKVEDVTTAIQTAWKMLGEASPPTISYHKDTKLLIAVGEQGKLFLIDEVLRQLANPVPKSDAKPSPPKATATEKSSKGE